MVDAERRLLANALRDPANQQFALLSDRWFLDFLLPLSLITLRLPNTFECFWFLQLCTTSKFWIHLQLPDVQQCQLCWLVKTQVSSDWQIFTFHSSSQLVYPYTCDFLVYTSALTIQVNMVQAGIWITCCLKFQRSIFERVHRYKHFHWFSNYAHLMHLITNTNEYNEVVLFQCWYLLTWQKSQVDPLTYVCKIGHSYLWIEIYIWTPNYSSVQWFTMKRQHAVATMADSLYYSKFRDYCGVSIS